MTEFQMLCETTREKNSAFRLQELVFVYRSLAGRAYGWRGRVSRHLLEFLRVVGQHEAHRAEREGVSLDFVVVGVFGGKRWQSLCSATAKVETSWAEIQDDYFLMSELFC